MDKKTLDALKSLVDYTLENEQQHWEENDKSKAHIYNDALKVYKWIKKYETTRKNNK